jgi:hypothetical protein
MSEVVIEVASGTLSGGRVTWLKEQYPFSKLTPARWLNDAKTELEGPSFVIPKSDNPPSRLAAGRKRLKNCVFVSRKINGDGDVRVWLHPDSPLPGEKAKPAEKPKASAKAKGA